MHSKGFEEVSYAGELQPRAVLIDLEEGHLEIERERERESERERERAGELLCVCDGQISKGHAKLATTYHEHGCLKQYVRIESRSVTTREISCLENWKKYTGGRGPCENRSETVHSPSLPSIHPAAFEHVFITRTVS